MSIPTNNSVNQCVLYTNPLTTFPQHRQISPTIFVCVHTHPTTSDNQSHSNVEIIDISDDDEEEDENTCKNGTSIDDPSDEEEIEVIQLYDDDEEDDDEVNDKSSGESSDKNSAKMDKDEINQFHNDFDESSLDITTWMQRQQSTNFVHQSGPSTSQTVKQDQSSFRTKDEVKSVRSVFRVKVVKTLGFSCCECSVLIDTRPKLAQHLHEVHGKLPFKCMVRGCNRQFTKRSLLNKHYEDHKKKQAKLICSAVDCQFETSIRQSFETHVYQHHDKGLFQCAQCLETYPLSSMAYKHLTTKHKYFENKTNKRFQCDFKSCQFVAASKFRLKTHQLTHTKLRPFQCTWRDCGYAVKSIGNAIVHIRINHLRIPDTIKKAKQRNIQCDQDPHQFVREIPYDLNEALRQELHKSENV